MNYKIQFLMNPMLKDEIVISHIGGEGVVADLIKSAGCQFIIRVLRHQAQK